MNQALMVLKKWFITGGIWQTPMFGSKSGITAHHPNSAPVFNDIPG
jgi:hypothetical protein